MTKNSVTSTSEIGEQEIGLLDLLCRLIAVRKSIYKAAGAGLIIGVIVALSIPKQYTVKVSLSPEMGTSKGGNGLSGLAASFLGNGVNMSEGADALNASLSADIVSSTPFLLGLSDMKVPVSNSEEMSLSTYLDEESSPWWSYVIGLPGMMIGGVKSLFSEEENTAKSNHSNKGVIYLTNKEEEMISALKKKITVYIDKETNIMGVSVIMQNPKVTAVVADSVVHKLQESIITYRTSKSKDDCAYLEKLFQERQKEYYLAQKNYANYIDSHDNLILQSVRAEQERLQNDMNLAYQVYSQVANQLQVARAKVQEEKPVFAVIEPAVVPLKTSNKGVMVYVLIFMFVFIFAAIVWNLSGSSFWKTLKEEAKNN